MPTAEQETFWCCVSARRKLSLAYRLNARIDVVSVDNREWIDTGDLCEGMSPEAKVREGRQEDRLVRRQGKTTPQTGR